MLLRFFILFFSVSLLLHPIKGVCTIANLFVDEIEAVDRAIKATEKRLAVQQQIKNFMIELRRLEEHVLNNKESKAQAAQMVKLAEKILAIIEAEHLQSLFSVAYLEELRFYSSFARKASLSAKMPVEGKAKE